MSLFDDRGAEFSECRKYRYSLWEKWDNSKPYVMFVGLNPSTATETKFDPTIVRVRNFAFDNEYGGFYMTNLHPFITAYPPELIRACTHHEKLNRSIMLSIAKRCKDVVFAWGSFIEAKIPGEWAERTFPNAKALIINQDGSPRHPLYVPGDTKLIDYKPVNFNQWKRSNL